MHKKAYIIGLLLGSIGTCFFLLPLVYFDIWLVLIAVFTTILFAFISRSYFKIYEELDALLAKANIFGPTEKLNIKQILYQTKTMLSILLLSWKIKLYSKR